MSELSSILADSVQRLFEEQVDGASLRRCEDGEWPGDLWTLGEELGLSRVLLGEDDGGAGGDWGDAWEIVSACGAHAVPLPIPETIAARWLCRHAGIDQPPGPLTLIGDPASPARVPWARQAHAALTVRARGDAGELLVVPLAGQSPRHGTNLAREPRDDLILDADRATAVPLDLPADTALHLGALLRAGQMAGASRTLLERALRYAGERTQFGRPLAAFQVIQHNLARLASITASLDAVTRTAFAVMDAVGFGAEPAQDVRLAIAAAKCRTSDCAEAICALAHQVHGAIGFTYEHDLHFLTRRLWSWRSEFGGGAFWAAQLGGIAAGLGAGGTWARITGLRTAPLLGAADD